MKKILSIFLVFLALVSQAQHDYTGSIVHVQNTLTSTDPRGKLFIVDAVEDSLYLPLASSIGGQVIAVIPNPYTPYVRLNQAVTYYYQDNAMVIQSVNLNYLFKTTQVSYLYSNGTSFEYYVGYVPPALSALFSTVNPTPVNTQLPHTAIAGEFGTTLNLLGGSENLILPNPTTLTPVSFKIVNQGIRQLTLNYPFKVDGTTRMGITNTEGGNMWEIVAEGGIYRAISNH